VEYTVQRSDTNDAVVVAVAGTITVDDGAGLHDTLRELCATPQPVLIDLAGTTELDRYGLSVLVQAARQLRQLGYPLAIVAPKPAVRAVFESSGVHEIIPICASQVEAVALTTVLRDQYREVPDREVPDNR